MDWKTIETAPKDGTNFLLAARGNEHEPPWKMWVGSFRPKRNEWAMFWTNAVVHPTHWMPLPEPPK